MDSAKLEKFLESVDELRESIKELLKKQGCAPAAEQAENRWPQHGDEYFYIDGDGDIFSAQWDGADLDRDRLAFGNVFETEEDAREKRDWLTARRILIEDTKGFKPNWCVLENKFFVQYAYCDDDDPSGLDVECACFIKAGEIYFENRKDAMDSIAKHRKEWMIYLGIETEGGGNGQTN